MRAARKLRSPHRLRLKREGSQMGCRARDALRVDCHSHRSPRVRKIMRSGHHLQRRRARSFQSTSPVFCRQEDKKGNVLSSLARTQTNTTQRRTPKNRRHLPPLRVISLSRNCGGRSRVTVVGGGDGGSVPPILLPDSRRTCEHLLRAQVD